MSCKACKDGVQQPFIFSMAFQPIIDVETARVYAYEALVRGINKESAGMVLSKVTEENRYAFDQNCRVKAITLAKQLGLDKTDAKLCINFMPGAVDPKPKNYSALRLRDFACDGSLEGREESRSMGKKGHSEEEILRVLREAESGDTVVEVCRKHGISQQTFYLWKRKYAGLGLSELRELRQLREENAKLKRLVADLSLDRHVLQEIVAKKL